MPGCTQGCKDEFQQSNFFLDHQWPHNFFTSQWRSCQCTGIFYLVYRLVVALGFIAIFILQWEKYIRIKDHPEEWFLFLSNWSITILTVDTIIQCVLAFHGYSRYRNGEMVWEKVNLHMPWYIKMEWVITNIATNAGFGVSIIFWGLLYPAGFQLDYNVINIHGVNSAYLFVNAFITAMPVRIYHAFHTYLYAILYLVVLLVYQLGFDKEPVYDILDFKKSPNGAALYTFLIVIVLNTCIWLLYYGLYRVRLVIADAIAKERSEPKVRPITTEMQTTEMGEDNPVRVDTVDKPYVSKVYVQY